MKKYLFGLSVLIVSLALAGCSNVGPVVKYLKGINNEPARNWISFLQKNGIDAIDSNGDTILLIAVKNNEPTFVEACLKSKANVNTPSKSAKFPLTIAVAQDNPEIVEMLLKAGAEIAPRANENNVAYAITRHFDKTLEVLLKYKPNLDYRTSEGTIFTQGTNPPKANIVTQLDVAGFKPSRADMFTLTQAYQYADTPEDEAAILSVIQKNAKDPVYREYLPNEEGNVLTLQYKSSYNETDGYNSYKKALAIQSVLLEAGIPATLTGTKRLVSSYDLKTYLDENKDKPYFAEIKAMFEKYGVSTSVN